MKLTNNAILLLILATTAILRFYNYFEIPYTHDELSAIFRLKVNGFAELIQKGVREDTHPAGVQVFLYFWTQLFGHQKWVVKLPFILFGICSVYLIYLIGKKWFNETVGLISAAYLATIQFTIVYGQIIRPYISGMFLSLLMIYFWSHLILNPNKNFYKNAVLFILSASLCTYNHYFSLLFAAIVGVSGIFFIQRKYLLKYILAGVLIFILYLPHLGIFFHHLSVGGVGGWVGKPENDFLINFIYYVLNYSIWVITITLALFLFGLLKIRQHHINIKFILLSLTWFILPFLVGFYYSRQSEAILQFSLLIFGTPLLFFVLFGFIKKQKVLINLIIVTVILITNFLTLVYGRKHYDLFYHSVYEKILTDYESAKEENKNCIFLIDSHKKISNYFITKLHIDTSEINNYDEFADIKELKRFLETESKSHDKLYLGCISSVPPNMVPLIQDYFRVIERAINYVGGNTYLFSKGAKRTENIITNLDFETDLSEKWVSVDSQKIIPNNDSIESNSYLFSNDMEWGPSFSMSLYDFISNHHNFIDISVDAQSAESLEGIVLVATLESKSEIIYWGGTDFDKFELADSTHNKFHTIHHSIKLSDLRLKEKNIVFKVYIWNKSKRDFVIDNFKISLREGNPIIYGLNRSL